MRPARNLSTRRQSEDWCGLAGKRPIPAARKRKKK